VKSRLELKDRIAKMLTDKTSQQWVVDDDCVYCDSRYKYGDIEDSQTFDRLFADITPKPRMVQVVETRGQQGTIRAEYRGTVELLELLSKFETYHSLSDGGPDYTQVKADIQDRNQKIAAMLTEKMGISWTSDEAGVRCDAIIDADNFTNGEKKFKQIMKDMGIEAHISVIGRSISDGKVRIIANFSTVDSLSKLDAVVTDPKNQEGILNQQSEIEFHGLENFEVVSFIPESCHVTKYKQELNVMKTDTVDGSSMQQFFNEHARLLLRDRKAPFGSWRETTITDKRKQGMDLSEIVEHAMESKNRSRQAFINLGWMKKDGTLTKDAPKDVSECVSKINDIKQSTKSGLY
jgi:hypothetical protein